MLQCKLFVCVQSQTQSDYCVHTHTVSLPTALIHVHVLNTRVFVDERLTASVDAQTVWSYLCQHLDLKRLELWLRHAATASSTTDSTASHDTTPPWPYNLALDFNVRDSFESMPWFLREILLTRYMCSACIPDVFSVVCIEFVTVLLPFCLGLNHVFFFLLQIGSGCFRQYAV